MRAPRRAVPGIALGMLLGRGPALGAQPVTLLTATDEKEAAFSFQGFRGLQGWQGAPPLCVAVSLLGSGTPPQTTGVVELASGFFQTSPFPSLPTYAGGSLAWTPDRVLLTTAGAGTATTEITIGGQPITGTQGIAVLASAFSVTYDAGGLATGVSIEGAAYIYTRNNVYLASIGGGVTVVEVTRPGGQPLGKTRGVAILGGQVFDNDPSPYAVDAVVQGGALLHGASSIHLHLAGGGSSTSEVLDPWGASITGTRGVTPMANLIPPPGVGGMESAAHVWTEDRVYLVLTGGGLQVSEVTDSTGAPLADAWGVVRLDGSIFQTASGNVYQGAAQVLTRERLYLVAGGGSVTGTEILDPAGGSIATGVRVPRVPQKLRQSGTLCEILGSMDLPGGGQQSGTIVGLNHYCVSS